MGYDVSRGTIYTRGARIPRELRDRFADVANIKDFGARGDGVVDDTVAIQAAIDSGRPVYVPDGTYYTANTLYLPIWPTAVRIFGHNQKYSTFGHAGTTHIITSAAVVFAPRVASTYDSISYVHVRISGLSIASTRTDATLFDRLALGTSRITDNHFRGFKHILYGTMVGVSSFDHNLVTACMGSAFKTLSNVDFNPNIIAPIIDSEVSDNYFNAAPYVAVPDFPVLDVPGAAAVTIARNYIDFAFAGIRAGGGNGLVTISNNTFDILYRAIELQYGAVMTTIIGNRFFRMRNASKSYFTFPTADMQANDWTCVYINQKAKGLTITGNVYKDSDRFIDTVYGVKWLKDIREAGNVGGKGQNGPGGSDLTGLAVRMPNRQVDEAGFVGQGETGDGTGFVFETMEGQSLTHFPLANVETYEGRRFSMGGVEMVTRGGAPYSTNGEQTWGRLNLAAAADYAAGWSAPGAGMTIAGGTATLDGTGTGWHYGDSLPAALQPGEYAVRFHIASITGGYTVPGIKLNDATILFGRESAPTPNAVGTYWLSFAVPVGKTGVALGVYGGGGTPFIGTLDYFTIIRLTSP